MKSRKILSLFLMIGFVFALTISAYGESYIKEVKAYFGTAKLRLNGEYLDKETVIIDGTTYVPLRAIGETLGLEVNWEDDIKTVDLTSIKAVDPTPSPKPTETAPLPTDTPAPTASPKPTETTTKRLDKNTHKSEEELEAYINKKYGVISVNIAGKPHDFEFYYYVHKSFENKNNYTITSFFPDNAMYTLLKKKVYFSNNYGKIEYIDLTEEEHYNFKKAIKSSTISLAEDLVYNMPESNLLGYYSFSSVDKSIMHTYGQKEILLPWSNFGTYSVILDALSKIDTAERQDKPTFFYAKYLEIDEDVTADYFFSDVE